MSMRKEDPRSLIQRAKEGDREAFTQLYNLYVTPMYRYVYFRIGNKEDVADLVQLIFVKAYKTLPHFPEMEKPPIAYFYTIAKNTIIDYRRKNKRSPIPFENVAYKEREDAYLLDSVEKKERIEDMYRALECLTEEQKEVIILRFIEELSVRETAHIMEKSEVAIRQLQCRALKKLRSHLSTEL